MARTLAEMVDALPQERRQRVYARCRELKDQVESLRELRWAAGKAQAEIAAALNIRQPSVSKIERQADMYLSTLRSYIEALGGELELVVRLPSRSPIRLHRLGELLDAVPNAAPQLRVAARPSGGEKAKPPRKRLATVP
jgi:transcriptional regulator with XRE-family HTH domain